MVRGRITNNEKSRKIHEAGMILNCFNCWKLIIDIGAACYDTHASTSFFTHASIIPFSFSRDNKIIRRNGHC